MSNLTEKQERFVSEFLIDMNGKQAAIRAGCSPRSAEVTASKWLRLTKVQDALAARRKKIAAKLEITQERVISELAKIGFSDIRNVVSWRTAEVPVEVEEELEAQAHGGALKRSRVSIANVVELRSSDEIDDITAASIAEVSQTKEGVIKIKLHDKRAALVDLGKHLGIFKEQVEHSGSVHVEVTRFSDE